MSPTKHKLCFCKCFFCALKLQKKRKISEKRGEERVEKSLNAEKDQSTKRNNSMRDVGCSINKTVKADLCDGAV